MLGVRWIGLPALKAQYFLLSTASLNILGHEHNRIDQPAVALWNDMSHKISITPGTVLAAVRIEPPPFPPDS